MFEWGIALVSVSFCARYLVGFLRRGAECFNKIILNTTALAFYIQKGLAKERVKAHRLETSFK